mgnify:CR=1 FL=1
MAIPILIIGKSGSGKSASMRNLDPNRVALINVLGKPLPFRGKFAQVVTDDYSKVAASIASASKRNRDIIIIDDAGYLITNMFMRGHSNAGAGNGVFSLYNSIGDHFWNLIDIIRAEPSNARVYLIMHEEMNDFGQVKPKTIGKLIDEKVCLEGMFTICLRCMISDGKHVFRTQSDGMDVTKSPMGMFEEVEIDNDLNMVDQKICEYYKEEE